MKINDYMISEKEKDQCSLMISAGKPGGDSPTQACKHYDHKYLLCYRFLKNAGLFPNHLLTQDGL